MHLICIRNKVYAFSVRHSRYSQHSDKTTMVTSVKIIKKTRNITFVLAYRKPESFPNMDLIAAVRDKHGISLWCGTSLAK